MKESTIFKKHFFLLCSGGLILGLLFISGFIVSYYFNNVEYVQSVPGRNSIYLLIWRFFFYGILIFAWKPFILKIFKNYKGNNKQKKIEYLIKYRKSLVLYIGFFEIIVVQNIFGHFLSKVL